MLRVGEEVVLMSAPGRHRVVEVHGDNVVIESPRDGARRTLAASAVRRLPPPKTDGKDPA